MFDDSSPDRWIGLLTFLGVLLPLGLWFMYDQVRERTRNTVAVVCALFLLVATVTALSRTPLIGYVLGSGGMTTGARRVLDPILVLLGLGIGLVVALGMRSRDEAAAYPAGTPVSAGYDPGAPRVTEPAVEPAAHPDVLGDDVKDAYWSSHAADGAPRALPALPAAPFDARTLLLFVVAVGLALPITRIGGLGGFSQLIQFSDVSGYSAIAIILEGVTTGLALLLPALALRGQDMPSVAAAFGLVAVGQGIATAFPDTMGNELWYMFAAGLAAGLLVPAALRLLTPALGADTYAVAVGVVTVVALLVAQSALYARAARDTFSSGFDFDSDDDTTIPAGPRPTIPPLPTLPGFPTDFPTGFPTGFPTELPSGFPTDFPFPSGFPTP